MSLDTYVITPRALAIGGKTLALTPLRMRQLPAFAKSIMPVAGFMMRGELLAALAIAGDDLVDAVTVAIGEPREWVVELLPDEFITLASAVMEVNTDFFVQHVAPQVTAAAESMTKALRAGATSSPVSSATDSV